MSSDKKLKILMLSYEFPPIVPGGIGKVTYDKYKAYMENGHDVVLIAPVTNVSNNKQIYIPSKNVFLKLLLMFFYAFLSCIKRKPDLIYSFSGTYTGIISFIISKLFSVPYVVMAHGNEFIRFYDKGAVKKVLNVIYNDALLVIAVSSFTKKLLLEFGVNRENVVVVNNFIDINDWITPKEAEIEPVRKKYKLGPEDFILITVSRLDARKGHDKVIEALSLLFKEHPELKQITKYLIIGKGKEYERLRKRVTEYKLDDCVSFLGYISYSELAMVYSVADLFVMPSSFLKDSGSVEGFGLSYIEAAVYGLPSIAGVESGAVDIIDNNKTGFLVNPDDTDKIKELLFYCIKNKTRVKKMGIAAREYVARNFSSEKLFSKEISLIIKCFTVMQRIYEDKFFI